MRGVIAASIASAVTMSVSRSQSTKTGFAPYRETTFGRETHVMEGVMTSSPGFRPSARNSACMTVVSEVSGIAYFAPV